MQNLIEQLLESEGLTRQLSTDLALYEYSSTGKTNYWLVIHGEPIITPEIQAGWLSKCKSATADPALEKNINLLIVWNTNSSKVLASKQVNHIEEDSYFFKKHVLPYTTEELEALRQQIETHGFSIVFRESITTPSTFTEYKSNYLEGGWQSLLYRIAIKLPFIAVNSSGNSNLASLERNIREKIQRTSNPDVLLATDSAIDFLANQITSPDVLPEDLLTYMDAKLLEAGYESDS
ncbi:ABC-three component system middle component 1 [uncultured Enterobacter sp.]|uniref:ABC-three component system middle component 1 n=1 Tax=uncultured Enterobacter sp. TaxID=238202 RepID=UPI0025919193|nr:ABC-three component system middle component 1 [uncultured Enterobacter sp.]